MIRNEQKNEISNDAKSQGFYTVLMNQVECILTRLIMINTIEIKEYKKKIQETVSENIKIINTTLSISEAKDVYKKFILLHTINKQEPFSRIIHLVTQWLTLIELSIKELPPHEENRWKKTILKKRNIISRNKTIWFMNEKIRYEICKESEFSLSTALKQEIFGPPTPYLLGLSKSEELPQLSSFLE